MVKTLKNIKKPILCLTAYTAPIAKIVDRYADIILVGDSVGPVLYGYNSTREVTLDMMINHASAVVKNSKKSIVVVDMPYGTYEKSKYLALKNAKRIIKESGASAVKLEGGKSISGVIKFLTENKVNVMGHIGMLPQLQSGDYRIFGKKKKEKQQIFEDLIFLEQSGVFCVVIECTIKSLVDKLVEKSNIPLIGIGASSKCSGQIIVTEDILGMTEFNSKFLKKYSNLKQKIDGAIRKFSLDVKKKKYPTKKHCYK